MSAPKFTPPAVAKECERRFQAGGPRIYYFDGAGNVVTPLHQSTVRATLDGAGEGQGCAQRRKVVLESRYAWVVVRPTGSAA